MELSAKLKNTGKTRVKNIYSVHILLQRKQHSCHISHVYYGTISKYHAKFLSDEFYMRFINTNRLKNPFDTD